jgi:hypothetical protein
LGIVVAWKLSDNSDATLPGQKPGRVAAGLLAITIPYFIVILSIGDVYEYSYLRDEEHNQNLPRRESIE